MVKLIGVVSESLCAPLVSWVELETEVEIGVLADAKIAAPPVQPVVVKTVALEVTALAALSRDTTL